MDWEPYVGYGNNDDDDDHNDFSETLWGQECLVVYTRKSGRYIMRKSYFDEIL